MLYFFTGFFLGIIITEWVGKKSDVFLREDLATALFMEVGKEKAIKIMDTFIKIANSRSNF